MHSPDQRVSYPRYSGEEIKVSFTWTRRIGVKSLLEENFVEFYSKFYNDDVVVTETQLVWRLVKLIDVIRSYITYFTAKDQEIETRWASPFATQSLQNV